MGRLRVVQSNPAADNLLEDPMHALLEIRRVLAPEGCMILTTPQRGTAAQPA
jgi:hypothetical protein